MFREIRIESYRGLRNIELTDLGQINVFLVSNIALVSELKNVTQEETEEI